MNAPLWNTLDNSIHTIESICSFKKRLKHLLHPQIYNKIFNISLLHTRLRLGSCALNSYLFKINRCVTQDCTCQPGVVESVEHYLLICPRYAAQRQPLLAYAAQLIRNFSNLSLIDQRNTFLMGSNDLTYDENKSLFVSVQKFILDTNRFTM